MSNIPKCLMNNLYKYKNTSCFFVLLSLMFIISIFGGIGISYIVTAQSVNMTSSCPYDGSQCKPEKTCYDSNFKYCIINAMPMILVVFVALFFVSLLILCVSMLCYIYIKSYIVHNNDMNIDIEEGIHFY